MYGVGKDSERKMHDGGLKDVQSECKIMWVYPNEDVEKCPVKPTQKYFSLCLRYVKKANFF